MAELGIREIGLIENGIKTIYDELFSLGVSENINNANDFRQSILQVLIQGTNDSNYATHTNILFNAFKPIEENFSQLKLETVIDYVKTNYDVLNETGQLSDIDIPEMMWTGYDDTANALEDIAIYLNDNYDFEIDTKNIDNILVDMSEQLMGSDIKVGDIPDALEIQIRVLDDMQYHEIAQMYTAWPSTEMMRPLTIQLTEIYNQVDNLDGASLNILYDSFYNYLYIGNNASDILIGINNPDNLKTVGVKNMIKHYFEQLGSLQTSYTEFSGANHAFLDGWQISNELDVPLSIAGDVGREVGYNLDNLLWNSKNPAQFLVTLKPFEGVLADIPYQVSSDYFNEYQNIMGKYVSKYFTDPNFASTIAEGKDLYTFINEDLKIAGYDLEETPDSEFLNRLSKTTEEDILKGTSIDTPTNVVNNIYDDAIEIFDTSELLKNGKLEHSDLTNKLMSKGYTFKEVETFLNDVYMKQVKDNPKGFENISKEEFIKYADTPTNVVDELEDAIIKSDGLDNLNKAKKVIGNNPGVFRKILSVLEKADVGDQVITKFILPKVLPAIGLSTVAAPAAIAYGIYETALLLSDVGQAAYKAQTTDESFWDNFGEVSDKYSIAYKISKPVYDIILDSLNEDLATEDKNEAMLFSFNR